MNTSLTLAAAALLALAPLAAIQAQEADQAGSSPFDILDTDHSGSLDTKEGQGHPVVSQNFAAADANSDGSLSREEFNSAFTTREPPTSRPSPTTPAAPPPTPDAPPPL